MKSVSLAVIPLLLLALAALPLIAAGAHERHAPPASGQACAICAQPVGDHPVTVRFAQAAHTYHDLLCALLASEGRGDVGISARSAITGKIVMLESKGGKWTAAPAGSVALSLSRRDKDCTGRRLAFSSRSEFDRYLKAHPEVAAEKPKPIPLTAVKEIIAAARPPLPARATCPVMKRAFKPGPDTAWTMRRGEVYFFCCPGCKQELDKP